jgi:hypothetical protein
MQFIRYLGGASVKMYDDMRELLMLNALWVLLTIPIITAPGAMAGLFFAIHKLAKNEPISARTFFDGFQKFFWVSWRLTLLNMAVFFTAYLNFAYYQNMNGSNIKWLPGIVLGLSVVWAMIQIYILPLLVEQNSKRIFMAIRDSVVLLFRYPGPLYATAIVLFLLSMISIWLFGVPWLLFLGSFSAALIMTTLMYVSGQTEYIDPVIR